MSLEEMCFGQKWSRTMPKQLDKGRRKALLKREAGREPMTRYRSTENIAVSGPFFKAPRTSSALFFASNFKAALTKFRLSG
jgi:hypothetical protein